MKNLSTYFSRSKKTLLIAGILVVTITVFFSCLRLRVVYYPEVVETNSTFEITMVADMNLNDHQRYDEEHFGLLGVCLPVGWIIDEESIILDFIPLEGASSKEALFFDEDYTNVCMEKDQEMWGDEYYWQGFSTDRTYNTMDIDSIVVRFSVRTNDQAGDYMMLVGIQQLILNADFGFETMRGPFYIVEEADRFSKEYLAIEVVQGATGIQYSKEDKENYNVVALGNGQILVNLKNDQKIGAQAIVYDMNGKQVASQQLNKTTNILDAILNPGVHFVAIQQDGIRSSKKILVK